MPLPSPTVAQAFKVCFLQAQSSDYPGDIIGGDITGVIFLDSVTLEPQETLRN